MLILRSQAGRPCRPRSITSLPPGSIVGCAGICLSRDPVDPSIGELDSIFVDEPHWRTGVGSALITVAHRHLAQDGYCLARFVLGSGTDSARVTWLPCTENIGRCK